MDKPSISSEKTKVQPEPTVEHTTPPSSAAYVESVRITPTRLWNAVLEKYHQGGSKGGRSE
ncbi:MAG: hypothetical protein H9855_18405 [Candidatus Acinetobacter avistercoris]|uniref:Uncharacterized protein n=1 Tax=Acinetobacter pseudolwoffii TaxID=2053287 RepID=N9M0Q2_9GAMM|nr:hypothetical protein F906_01704 [Acinetobacter pseudolwoffii]MBU3848898.1 hypothetical protein [Candidatus Acinetobacter avistercoris]